MKINRTKAVKLNLNTYCQVFRIKSPKYNHLNLYSDLYFNMDVLGRKAFV